MTARGAAAAKSRFAPRDVRRRQLILSAIDAIAEHGFSNTTLRHVTEGADLSLGVVNYHFDGKESLYDETLRFLAEEHYELWTRRVDEAGPDPARQLQAIVEADFDPEVCSDKKLAVWFAFWGQASYRPSYLEIHKSYDAERMKLIHGLCATLAADSPIPVIDPDTAARMIVAQADGAWLMLLLFPSEATRKDYLRDSLNALACFFPHHFPGTCAKGEIAP